MTRHGMHSYYTTTTTNVDKEIVTTKLQAKLQRGRRCTTPVCLLGNRSLATSCQVEIGQGVKEDHPTDAHCARRMTSIVSSSSFSRPSNTVNTDEWTTLGAQKNSRPGDQKPRGDAWTTQPPTRLSTTKSTAASTTTTTTVSVPFDETFPTTLLRQSRSSPCDNNNNLVHKQQQQQQVAVKRLPPAPPSAASSRPFDEPSTAWLLLASSYQQQRQESNIGEKNKQQRPNRVATEPSATTTTTTTKRRDHTTTNNATTIADAEYDVPPHSTSPWCHGTTTGWKDTVVNDNVPRTAIHQPWQATLDYYTANRKDDSITQQPPLPSSRNAVPSRPTRNHPAKQTTNPAKKTTTNRPTPFRDSSLKKRNSVRAQPPRHKHVSQQQQDSRDTSSVAYLRTLFECHTPDNVEGCDCGASETSDTVDSSNDDSEEFSMLVQDLTVDLCQNATLGEHGCGTCAPDKKNGQRQWLEADQFRALSSLLSDTTISAASSLPRGVMQRAMRSAAKTKEPRNTQWEEDSLFSGLVSKEDTTDRENAERAPVSLVAMRAQALEKKSLATRRKKEGINKEARTVRTVPVYFPSPITADQKYHLAKLRRYRERIRLSVAKAVGTPAATKHTKRSARK